MRLALGRIHPSNGDLIESELFGRLRDHTLDDPVRLHRPRRPLLRARGRVGHHVHRAPPHGGRLIDQGRRVAGGAVVTHRPVRAAVLNNEEVERRDTAVRLEPDLRAAGHVRPRPPDVTLFLAADAHHHRRVCLLRQQRRNGHRHGASALAAETASGVLGDQHEILRLDADPACHGVHRTDDALGGAVQIQLAVLPVRHRAARFERMVSRGLHDECLVEHEVRVLELGLEVAERPLLQGGAHGQATLSGVGEIRVGPLEARHGRPLAWRGGGRPHIAVGSSVGAPGTQTLDGVDDKRQRFDVEPNQLDRVGGDLFADGCHGEDRLARVERLGGEAVLGRALQLGYIVRRQNGSHAGEGHRAARIDVSNPRVRPLAEHQLAEEHAIREKVFGVPRAAGDLGHEIGGDVVRANESICHCGGLQAKLTGTARLYWASW